MASGPWECALKFGDRRVLLADSATAFADLDPNDVIVCGSHGGATAALFAAASGAKAVPVTKPMTQLPCMGNWTRTALWNLLFPSSLTKASPSCLIEE